MARPREMENPTRLEMRIPTSLVEEVDRWRGVQPGVPGRSEAVRRLVEKGLNAWKTEGQTEGGATA